MKVNELEQDSPEMGSLSSWTILKNFSSFSLEQFICISTNHPGCRNIHREMQVQTQWRCAQGTQILGLASGCSFSILLLCWHWKYTYQRSELVFAVFCGPSAHPWDAGGETSQWLSWGAVVELVLSALGKWLQCLTVVSDIWNTCEDSAVHMWPGLHIALSFSLSCTTNARRVLDFSEAGKWFLCFVILF